MAEEPEKGTGCRRPPRGVNIQRTLGTNIWESRISERTTDPFWAIRLRCTLLGGYEPRPAEFIVRQPCYPWLVVATTCIAAFIGQLDASIVQRPERLGDPGRSAG